MLREEIERGQIIVFVLSSKIIIVFMEGFTKTRSALNPIAPVKQKSVRFTVNKNEYNYSSKRNVRCQYKP